MQKAIIVSNDTRELNTELAKGWRVVAMCGMPSSMAGEYSRSTFPTCLVVLTDEDPISSIPASS